MRWRSILLATLLGMFSCNDPTRPPVDGSGSSGGQGATGGGGTPPTDAGADSGDGGTPASDFPNEGSTGPIGPRCGALEDAVARTLTPADQGTIIANKRFREGFRIEARNVTIRCCDIAGVSVDTALVLAAKGDGDQPDGLTIEDTSIHGPSADTSMAGALQVVANDVTIRRTNVYFASTGVRLDGDNALVEDSFVHDLTNSGSVLESLVSVKGHSRLTVRHNTVENPSTGGVAFALRHSDGLDPLGAAPYSDVLVERNLFAGGRQSVDAGGSNEGVPFAGTNVRFLSNVVSTKFFPAGGSFAPVTGVPPEGNGYTWDANVWLDGAKAGQTIVAP